MSVDINPKKIKGKWNEGYSLDIHTLSSTFLGYNAYGHPDFDTKRSALGELLYKLKYGAGADAVEIGGGNRCRVSALEMADRGRSYRPCITVQYGTEAATRLGNR